MKLKSSSNTIDMDTEPWVRGQGRSGGVQSGVIERGFKGVLWVVDSILLVIVLGQDIGSRVGSAVWYCWTSLRGIWWAMDRTFLGFHRTTLTSNTAAGGCKP